ncbi:unnamed protein product [Didymodactylos carnosus]|uniref:Uncharacterized protein n=1 Tax=Didymodactylos carnosus TaxID=1234261 RepID=A0A813TGD0_9BILA|nr:unnamed protein product [Didymodactylos carnosus]CAF3596950.1 unnamed protein product [Didymodactylos carnosus]
MLEWNHTHFLLLDDGQLRGYLSDLQRSSFVQAAVDDRNRDMNFADSVFKAIFSAYGENTNTNLNESRDRSNTNFQSEKSQSALLELAVKWECLDAAKELFERKRNRDEELKFKEKIQKPTLSQILQPTGVLPLPGLSSGSADVSVGLSFSDR